MFNLRSKTGLVISIVIAGILLSSNLVLGGTGYGLSNVFAIDNRGTTDVPVITGIGSPYCSQTKKSYFLNGVSLNQTFTATIDWNGFTASQVKWYRNSTVIATDTVSGNSVSRTFNVGTAFNVGDRLYVQAIASNGTASSKSGANFSIILPPTFIPSGFFRAEANSSLIYKSMSFSIGFPEIDANIPDKDISGPGKDFYEIGNCEWHNILEANAEITSDGRCKINIGSDGFKKIKIAGYEFDPSVEAFIEANYSEQWYINGGIYLHLSAQGGIGPKYIIIMAGPAPIPFFAKLNIGVDIAAGLEITGIGDESDIELKGKIPISGRVEVIAGVGVSQGIAAEIFGAGTVNLGFEFPPMNIYEHSFELEIGYRAYCLCFKYEGIWGHIQWPEEQGAMALGMKAMTAENLEPMSRDYLTKNYAQWNSGSTMLKTMDIQAMGAGGTETTLQTNIFGQSNAVLAVSGSTRCLVWLYDEPSRNSLDRTMLVYSINSGSDWSAPAAINDDGTADAMPALAVDSSGNFVCVWADASQLIPDGTNLAEFADKLDITMATYNLTAGTWTTETVTNATALDYNPKVACDSSGNITVVWTHDDNNDMLAENPPVSNTLLARTKTDAGWQTAQTLTTINGLVKFSNIVADSNDFHLVYCMDTDSDLETDTDNELYYIVNTGGSWSASTRLTNDPNADVNPQLIKKAFNLMLIWARDGKIVSTTDIPGMTGITEVVAQEGSSGQRGFVAAISPTGNISVVWNDPSAAGSDLYMSTFDPTMSAWSDVTQITNNRDMERSISAVYTSGSTFEMAYNKVHIVDANGLGVFGQVALCAYSYPIGSDVAVVGESIKVTDPNAVPSETATLQATIVNTGDVSVADVPVAFYCGSVAIPANQIGQTQMILGNLAAGAETTVSVSCTIPESSEPLNVIVVADPDLSIQDKNRQNNSASVALFGANLSIQNVHVDSDINGTFYVSVDIANTGFIPVASTIAVKLTPADEPDTTIDSQSMAGLDPNQSNTVVLTVQPEDVVYGFNEFKLVLDPDNVVPETVENDNQRNVLVRNTVPYDLAIDGVIDILDICVLAQQWLNTTSGLTADIAPHGGDGEVNLADFAEIANHWLKDYRPILMPNLVGMTRAQAEQVILDADLTIGGITEEYSDVIEYGNVISQIPTADIQVNPGRSVTLVISKGPEPVAIVEDFETGNFTKYPWQHSGNAQWVIVSDTKYEGSYAAKSGTITHNQTSTLEVTLNTPFGNISFYRKVSSESNYDFLRFYIDGVQQGTWSGNQDWTQQTYSVTPGQHTFKWSYTKDSSVNSGSDCAWIDNILLY